MAARPKFTRYDIVVAGARVAGASTAMLLARQGLRVLVVDPIPVSRDVLSTHALMRGAVVQLQRWGLLDEVRAAGTPTIEATTFHYGPDSVTVPIKPRDGVDGLYAPRRTVLDPILLAAARRAGAEVVHGLSVAGVVQDASGRVIGVEIRSGEHEVFTVGAGLVVGADGLRSKVARLVGAPVVYAVPHATASIYGYWPGLERNGYEWSYAPNAAMGVIPTNGGESCVFVSMPPSRFHSERDRGLLRLHHETVRAMSPALAADLAQQEPAGQVRGFAGASSIMRKATGPGWALVGDAGYFKDPLTAHGITDALRDAELLARSISDSGDTSLQRFEDERDALSRGLMDVTSRIASFEWSLDEVKALHLTLSREMNAEVEAIRSWERARSAA